MWNKDSVGSFFFTNYLACLADPVNESVCEVIAWSLFPLLKHAFL